MTRSQATPSLADLETARETIYAAVGMSDEQWDSLTGEEHEQYSLKLEECAKMASAFQLHWRRVTPKHGRR